MIDQTQEIDVEAIIESITQVQEAIKETFIPAWQEMIRTLSELWIVTRRFYLFHLISPFLPDRIALWLSNKWPARWLPTLDETSLKRWTETEQ